MTLPENFLDMMVKEAKIGLVSAPHVGFVLNTDPIKTEIAQRTAIYTEMGIPIMAARTTEETWFASIRPRPATSPTVARSGITTN